MRRALAFAAAVPWAIRAEWLSTILRVANYEGEGVEAVEARLGRPLQNAQQTTVRDGVAIVPMVGPIFRHANMLTEVSGATSTSMLARDFTAALEDPNVSAILLNVDSPGGEIAGIDELSNMVHAARGRKPIAAYIGGAGASAAYWIASAADRIVAEATALVGSIGVVAALTNPNAPSEDGAAADIEIVSSQSPRKRPDPTTESGRAIVQESVDAIAEVFVATVARNRGTTTARVLKDFGAGGELVGEAARAAGMIDAIGSFEGTLAALAKEASTSRATSRAAQEDSMSLKSIARTLGLPEDAPEETIEARAKSVLGENTTLKETIREREIATILGSAKTKGLTPAQIKRFVAVCGGDADGRGANPEQLRAMVDAIEPTQTRATAAEIVEPTARASDGTDASIASATLSPREKKIARQNGMKPEEYAEHKAKWHGQRRAEEQFQDEDKVH